MSRKKSKADIEHAISTLAEATRDELAILWTCRKGHCPPKGCGRTLLELAEAYPYMIVSDNGTELTSNAILKWQHDRFVEWHYIAPGKPMQNGFVESTRW